MRQTITFLFSLFILFCNAQLEPETEKYIDSLMNESYKPDEPGAVILVAKEGKVYDSLAEAYLANGDKEAAIKNYKKSIALNPENMNGIEMLKKIK